MNKSFKTFFFLKKGHGYQGGPMPIYLRVTVNRQRAELSIQRSCEPKKWNQAAGRATGTKTETSQLNTHLDSIQANIFDIQKEFELRKESVTAELVKEKLLGRSQEKKHTLVEVYQYHNQQVAELVGREYAPCTLKWLTKSNSVFYC